MAKKMMKHWKALQMDLPGQKLSLRGDILQIEVTLLEGKDSVGINR